MIDINKKYTTRNGCEVRLFTTEARDKDYSVAGEFCLGGEWFNATWTEEGKYSNAAGTHEGDLIESKPEPREF